MGDNSVDTIHLTIDGRGVEAKRGMTVLEAALDADIYIPHLCYHPDLSPSGACRLCIVEIEKERGFPTACTTPVRDGMVVRTNSPEIHEIRRFALQLLIAGHPDACLTCNSNMGCELQALAAYLGITDLPFPKSTERKEIDLRNPLFIRDLNKCILCGRCIAACQELRGVGAISFINRGKETVVGTAFDRSLVEADCRFCLACVEVCPTGALTDRDITWRTQAEREAALVPCKHACPAGIDIPRYVWLVGEGRFSEAAAVIREKVPFPQVLGRICPHPCEDACRREKLNEPIAIRMLKRFAAENDDGLWKKNSIKKPPTSKRVAIIGSGPAGLTAAYYLTKLGHSVTVHEESSRLGGMISSCIPEYRLPSDVLRAEIDEILQIGFEVKTDTRIESLAPLFEQGYDSIFVAVGAQQCYSLRVDGEDSLGVMNEISFLKEVKLGKKVELGSKVAVIGGGNCAMDVARTAIRLDVKEVTVLYRRTRDEMPAGSEEVDEALREGVEFIFLTNPTKITSENGKIKLECIRMELGELDSSGRRRPIPILGSEFVMEFDTVIPAIGQRPEIPDSFEIEVESRGTVQVDPNTLETSREGVFAGGDAVSGAATVIEAIASGQKAASSIDQYLGGNGIIDEELMPLEECDPFLGRCEGFSDSLRETPNHISMEERLSTFKEVEISYLEEAAIREAKRCLRCDLRLEISPVILPPLKIYGRRIKTS